MPISDLFKKSPKQEPPIQSSQEDVSDSPELQKQRYDAALGFLKIFQERMPLLNGKPHAGTVLAVAARLAGTSLYRSMNYKHEASPGVIVLSEEVNEAWPQLLNLFAYYCKKNGIDITSRPMITKFPDRDNPLMTVEEVIQEYQDHYYEVMQKHKLDYLNSARAGIIVSSIVFQYHCISHKDIDPYVAAGIVAMGIVEGAKTTPPPLGSGGKMKTKDVSRLLLGEREAVIQESQAHGGKYIDPNPEVSRLLSQGAIDPYVIYERAMLDQIEAKISRIDFVNTNVDEAFEEWKWKLASQAPIHIRLLIWLKNNASTYGYEQSGNSWVLKR